MGGVALSILLAEVATSKAEEAEQQAVIEALQASIEEQSIHVLGGIALPDLIISNYRAGRLSDVTIDVESTVSFAAHQLVLASGSDYFRLLIMGTGSQMAFATHEDGTSILTLKELDAAIMRAVLDWLYTGECVVGLRALLDLLAAACRLQVQSLHNVLKLTVVF